MADKNFFKDLLGALKNATSTVFEKHKESNAVIFIRDSIKRTENILKTIDKMLKKRILMLRVFMMIRCTINFRIYAEKGKYKNDS
jgi:hypothetical protein